MLGGENTFVAALLASALNRNLSAPHCSALSRHAGRIVGFRWRVFSMNWRIGQDGRFVAVSPLADADAAATAAGGEVRLRGDAKLLRLLSEVADEADWPVIVSGVFGPLLAPRMLYCIERGRERFFVALQQHTASPAEVADYGGRVGNFRQDVERLSARLSALSGGEGAR